MCASLALQEPPRRVFWQGRHSSLGWGGTVGKLHKEGLQVLEGLGWERVSRDTDLEGAEVAFSWTTRRGGDFDETAAGPRVRQLPQSRTAALDDKRLFADLVGDESVTPRTHTDLDALARSLADADGRDATRYYYAKHRNGVKGKAVVPLRGDAELRRFLDPSKDRSDFVVQEGVASPRLLDGGRRFVLRAHSLVAADTFERPARAWLHRDVIRLPYATVASGEKSDFVSQYGKTHPTPTVLSDDDLADAELFHQLQRLVASTLAAARHRLLPDHPCRDQLYALLAYDLMQDDAGRAYVLEVNSYPAIASGTMSRVDRRLYTRLVEDVLGTLVLPHLDGTPPNPDTGFVPLPIHDRVGRD